MYNFRAVCVMKANSCAKLNMLVSMFIFGTIGLFVDSLALPSAFISLVRAVVGTAFLLIFGLFTKSKPSLSSIKGNLPKLVLSGIFLGLNWVLLFESYRHTSVAVATLCYYFAPIIVVFASPVLFGEKLTPKKILCALAALLGMVGVSGLIDNGMPSQNELYGIVFGLCAAVFYACVVLTNKKISGISARERTTAQLAISIPVLLIYSAFTVNYSELVFNTKTVVLLAVVGIVHTGIAYLLYFGAISNLKAQTVALFSYLDPIIAVILSWTVLGQFRGIFGVVGATLIIGAALLCELPSIKKIK